MPNKNKSTHPKGSEKRDPCPNDIEIFTLDGYTELFGTDENKTDVATRFNDICEINVKSWMDYLVFFKKDDLVKHLFEYWEDCCDSCKLVEKDDLIKFIELFSLAENVLRNALLRPYIPAYRTINMNCGRYITSKSKPGDELFRQLKFDKTSENLLTYQEEDQNKTILYALTCYVFSTDLSTRLKDKRGTPV